MNHISIIGRDWQMREDVQGFYRPDDAMTEGAKQGAWFGGFFGLFMGMGMFVFPSRERWSFSAHWPGSSQARSAEPASAR